MFGGLSGGEDRDAVEGLEHQQVIVAATSAIVTQDRQSTEQRLLSLSLDMDPYPATALNLSGAVLDRTLELEGLDKLELDSMERLASTWQNHEGTLLAQAAGYSDPMSGFEAALGEMTTGQTRLSHLLPHLPPGYFMQKFEGANSVWMNANESWGRRGLGLMAATITAPFMLFEEGGRQLFNAPGTLAAGAERATDVITLPTREEKILAGLEAIRNVSFGSLALAPLVPSGKMMSPLVTFESKVGATKAAANSIRNTASEMAGPGFDTSNLQSKLQGYLLDPAHPQNQTKAVWFEKALGFNKDNWQNLASQLKFDQATATQTKIGQYGTTYEQVIPVAGANGNTVNTTFVFMKSNNGVVRLVTGIPTKR